jgi:CubicO group peptidase (beta-lactamase class C family)
MAVAGLFALAILAAGGVALLVVTRTEQPLYTDATAVPSIAADADGGRHTAAVEKARGLARASIVEWNLPSLSVAVAIDGQIVWAEGFGFADAGRRVPVTPNMRFRTGSVSKTMTAAAVALLHDRKRIDLDAAVQRYVPSYPEKQWTVTTRHVLGDVGGVHLIRGDGNDQRPRGYCRTVDEALTTFAYEPLIFEPGTRYRFSTSGWILLSAVIEGAAGEPFATFMTREVFTPLGMARTALEGTPETDADRESVTFYFRTPNDDDSELRTAPAADYACFFGAGAYQSTPSDLARLGSAWLKPGFLKGETIALFQTPVRLASGASTDFALGWAVEDIQLAGKPARVVRHRASLIGGVVSLSLFPHRGMAIAITSHVPNRVAVDDLALRFAEVFVSAGG